MLACIHLINIHFSKISKTEYWESSISIRFISHGRSKGRNCFKGTL